MIDLTERISSTLGPHLGEATADSVARHLCAKHGMLEGQGEVAPERVARLREEIRRGLVAFVGPEQATLLAERCFSESA